MMKVKMNHQDIGACTMKKKLHVIVNVNQDPHNAENTGLLWNITKGWVLFGRF